MLSPTLPHNQNISKPTFEGYRRLALFRSRDSANYWVPSNDVKKMIEALFKVLIDSEMPDNKFLCNGILILNIFEIRFFYTFN